MCEYKLSAITPYCILQHIPCKYRHCEQCNLYKESKLNENEFTYTMPKYSEPKISQEEKEYLEDKTNDYLKERKMNERGKYRI